MMSVKKYKAKLVPYILCLSMVSGNFLTADAAEAQAAKDNPTQESILKSSDSNYFVIMPKAVTLDTDKYGEYSVTVTGEIPCSKRVYVSPVDGIEATDKLDFYMKNQASENGKPDVAATITQNKVYWNHEEVLNAYRETGSVKADSLSAGTWKGTFEIAINLLDDPDHKHEYTGTITKEPTCTEEGERTYTCECGDTYTEKVPATGHSYGEDDKCEHCGELNPSHEHNYTEAITKEPTCTEEGEKTYTCECGDTYTEKVPATGHSYGEGNKCEHCGELNPSHEHTYTEAITKEPSCTEEGERTYTCECGDTYTETIPMTHNYQPLWFNHDTPKSLSRSTIAEGSSTKTNSGSISITLPEWYPADISYTYTGTASVYGYVSGSASCGVVTSSASNVNTNTSNSTNKRSGSRTVTLRPGSTMTASISINIKSKSGSSGYATASISFPSLDTYLDKTQHMCKGCGEVEEHWTSCVDTTRDEYYFCEACGLQFRHRCKFDDSNVNSATCTGGETELTCIDDYYDTTHKLFTTCGKTSLVHFDGLGHDFGDDDICKRCGLHNPAKHQWEQIERNIIVKDADTGAVVKRVQVDTYNSSSSNSRSAYMLIQMPVWYEGYLTVPVHYYLDVPQGDYSNYRYFSSEPSREQITQYNNYNYSSRPASSQVWSYKDLNLYGGDNYVHLGLNMNSNNSDKSARTVLDFPDIQLPRELCSYHVCKICYEKEEHYTSCTDDTMDEYYFCEGCGQQFRHRCKYDDSLVDLAGCEGGDYELACMDDYYDTGHVLFDTCGETATVHFDGTGHDWKPWVVQVNPEININPDSSTSKYTFSKSGNSYYGTIGITNSSQQTSAAITINLPENFNGTYSLPVRWNITSSDFTALGYSLGVNISTTYDSGSSSTLNYSIGTSDTDTKTTSGSGSIVLKPGKNVIVMRMSASTNLPTWYIDRIKGSCSITFPDMPDYIFDGSEVHKCSRCNIEESHADKLRVIERKDATCIADGYIIYTCDDCGVRYEEILSKHPDDHADDDHDYWCDDCGKDLKTCEEFGHVIEHIQKSYTIAASYSVGANSKWYIDHGYYYLKLTPGTAWSTQSLTVTYNVPKDFPGEYYWKWTYVSVWDGENGGKWSYSCTDGTKGGPYMEGGYAPITLKAGANSVTLMGYSLDQMKLGTTTFATGISDSFDIDVDVYHCTRCGRTETYNFGNEASVQADSDEDTIYAADSEIFYEEISESKETESSSNVTEKPETDGTDSDENASESEELEDTSEDEELEDTSEDETESSETINTAVNESLDVD